MSSLPASRLLLQRDGAVVTLLLQGANPLHVLDRATLEALVVELGALASEAGVGALVLAGSGTTAFSAGAHLGELAELDGQAARVFSELGQRVTGLIFAFPAPVVAAIEGICFGGGLELAVACDLRVASETARFAYPAARLGILPGWGGTQRCPGIVGLARAKELMYLGRELDAADAQAWGLIHEVAPAGGAIARALALASELAERDAHALGRTKACLNRCASADFAFEREAFAACFDRPDVRARLKAWKESRKA